MTERFQELVSIVLITMVFILFPGNTRAADKTPTHGDKMITVLSPLGIPPLIKRVPMAPRPDSLNGKTIYLVDVRFNDGDILLQQMQAWFRENMPEVKTRFVRKSGIYTFDDKELWQEIREKGNGVIMAVGH